MRWFRRKPRQPKQTTFLYCPTCNLEQVGNDCFLEDTDMVRYQCKQCGTKTEWLFDAPVPILILVNCAPSHYFDKEHA